MGLETTIRYKGTELEIDLDELQRYGHYYIDSERDLIINANVFTHGTEDSRFVRETQVGTDYILVPVEVDCEDLQQTLEEELSISISDREVERIATYYRQAGVEVIGAWANEFNDDRFLTKAECEVISTGVVEPLLGWNEEFDDLIDREEEVTNLTTRDITSKLLRAASDASPGEHEYSARIKLTT